MVMCVVMCVRGGRKKEGMQEGERIREMGDTGRTGMQQVVSKTRRRKKKQHQTTHNPHTHT